MIYNETDFIPNPELSFLVPCRGGPGLSYPFHCRSGLALQMWSGIFSFFSLRVVLVTVPCRGGPTLSVGVP